MKKIFHICLMLLLLSGCKPSSEEIQEYLLQTKNAIISQTPLPTDTPNPTSTPTLTSTPEPTFTPTPDLRIVDGEPPDFLLKQEDLPKESQYYLYSNDSTGRTSSQEMIDSWGNDLIAGQEFIEKTQRLDSWFINLVRGSTIVTAPESLGCSVGKHSSNQGVITYIEEYNFVEKPNRHDSTWTYSNDIFEELGEHSLGIATQYYNDYGQLVFGYRVEAQYYNYYVACWGFGLFKEEVNPEYISNLVKIVLDKLKTAPLISP